MDILYVAHCVPWPPDRGERSRAFHLLRRLAERHRVHLACIAHTPAEAACLSPLRDQLASVRIEPLDVRRAVLRGVRAVARGRSFTTAFHAIPELQAHVKSVLADNPVRAVVLGSPATAGYAPVTVPFLADWGDVDLERYRNLARMRFPGLPHRLEALLLRRDERRCALRARRTFVTTPDQLRPFRRIVPDTQLACSGDGVDVGYFNPGRCLEIPDSLAARNYLVFAGVLDDAADVDAVRWFADLVFPRLRARDCSLELLLVGPRPTRDILALGQRDGITVTGAVEDVRPYLAAARAAIAPQRLAGRARHTVLEALAMGKRVLASDAVCRTFRPELPPGVVRCPAAADYVAAAADLPAAGSTAPGISEAARLRFSWKGNLAPIIAELDAIEREGERLKRAA